MRLSPAVRPGVSVKLVAAVCCAAGGGLAHPAVARLLTAVSRLATRVVSCPSWAASSLLVGGYCTIA